MNAHSAVHSPLTGNSDSSNGSNCVYDEVSALSILCPSL
jgi:hypothetical protein